MCLGTNYELVCVMFSTYCSVPEPTAGQQAPASAEPTMEQEEPATISELDEAMKEIQASINDLGVQPTGDASEDESDSEDEEEGGCGCGWS